MAELTYCSNIHPGESWEDVMRNLDSHALEVRNRLELQTPFPLGLRLSARAAGEIDAGAVESFRAWCDHHGAYLLTINGFPYGNFHGERVKERVYLPDWRTRERVAYSNRLGDLAVRLQPDAGRISISTVPIAFKAGFYDADWEQVYANIRESAAHYRELHETTGVQLVLAIEPEPLCVLETMTEALAFFDNLALPAELEEYVGLCFDCCHQAVEYENPAACLRQIQQAGIPIGKVQVSSALQASKNEFDQLLAFDEPVYLHQALAKRADSSEIVRFVDLPDFQAALRAGERFDQCRVHFHVPIFLDHLGSCGTTQSFLRDFLPLLDEKTPLEVETYSFGVIPEKLRSDSVADNIARELQWVRQLLKI